MPIEALRHCPGQKHRCPNYITGRQRRCSTCEGERESTRDLAEIRKLYHTARWRRLRDDKQRQDPFCDDCRSEDIETVWTELDHTIPHRGDLKRFWDPDNLTGKCKVHHDAKTAREVRERKRHE